MLNSELHNYYKMKATADLNMQPNDLIECEYDSIFNQCVTYYDYELTNMFSGFMHILFLVIIIGIPATLVSFILIHLYPNTFDVKHKYDIEDLENEDEIIYEYRYIDELEDLLNKYENNCCSNMPSDSDYEIDEEPCWEYTNDDEDNLIQCECTLHTPPPMTEDMKKNLSNQILSEATPDGNVLMYYNYDTEVPDRSSFHYYSNNKNIPFKYLDTVARKYVCTYKCVEIYRYLKDEIENEIYKIKEEREREQQRKEDNANNDKLKKTNDVFATFKNYKKNSNSIGETKRSLLITKNRYTRIGTFDEYNNQLTLPTVNERKQEIKKISFSEFKKMQQYNQSNSQPV